MEIKKYNQLYERAKSMDFNDAFNQYIKGQVVRDHYSVPAYGDHELPHEERYYGEGIVCENGYKMISFGGGCSGEDCNTTFIIYPDGMLLAKSDW